MRQVLASLDHETEEVMQEIMTEWRERRRGESVAADSGGGNSDLKENVSIPLGPGEWDEALGIPICVVCQNVSAPDTRRLSLNRLDLNKCSHSCS